MTRDMIDDYLDGAVEAADRANLERAFATDPVAADLLKAMKAERELRAQVFAGYEPSRSQASAFAAQVLQACADDAAAPVGRIGQGSWIRWGSGIAAAIAIAVGAFGAGRMSASPTVVFQEKLIPVEKTTYSVAVVDPRGNYSVSPDFTDIGERNEYIRQHDTAGNNTTVADADYILPGHL